MPEYAAKKYTAHCQSWCSCLFYSKHLCEVFNIKKLVIWLGVFCYFHYPNSLVANGLQWSDALPLDAAPLCAGDCIKAMAWQAYHTRSSQPCFYVACCILSLPLCSSLERQDNEVEQGASNFSFAEASGVPKCTATVIALLFLWTGGSAVVGADGRRLWHGAPMGSLWRRP